MGYVRPYSPEYRAFGTDEATLIRLAEIGGGTLIADLAAEPAAAFSRGEDEEAVRTYADVWPWLLGIAVCLLPLDVGVRRVAIDPGDLRRVVTWVRSSFRHLWQGRARRAVRPSVRATGPTARLMAAKERAPVRRVERERPALDGDTSTAPPQVGGAGASGAGVEPPPEAIAVDRAGFQDRPASPASSEPGEIEEGTMTARLLAAKRRAQQREEGE
jgi:hypothetical protein